MERELIHVAGGGGEWHLVYRDQTYGSYETAQEALDDARMWAENAERQGHIVQVVIDRAEHHPEQWRKGDSNGAFPAAKESR